MIARVASLLAGLLGLVGDRPLWVDEREALRRSRVSPQYVADQTAKVRKRRASRGRRQGTPANPYGNNRARRGGFKRRYSGHV